MWRGGGGGGRIVKGREGVGVADIDLHFGGVQVFDIGGRERSESVARPP